MQITSRHRKRCKRYNVAGHAHELTFSCYKRREFLSKERACRYLAEAVIRARSKHDFLLFAYVFMPEHVHLIIQPKKERYSISDILASIKQSVSRRALIYLRKENPGGLRFLETGQKHSPYMFWQDGGGYDRNIVERDTIISMIEYIHNNPVRRGFVDDPLKWKWSSARDWHGCGVGPIPIDRELLVS